MGFPYPSYAGGATPTVRARYHQTSAQTINSTANAVLNFDTEDVDSLNAVTTGAAWQFKAPLDGDYMVSVSLVGSPASAIAANVNANLQLLKNGSQWGTTPLSYFATGIAQTAATPLEMGGTDIVECKAGDTIQVKFTNSIGQNFTSTLNSSFIAICKVG